MSHALAWQTVHVSWHVLKNGHVRLTPEFKMAAMVLFTIRPAAPEFPFCFLMWSMLRNPQVLLPRSSRLNCILLIWLAVKDKEIRMLLVLG